MQIPPVMCENVACVTDFFPIQIILDCELFRIAHQICVDAFFTEITLDFELLHIADWHYDINSDSRA